MTKGKECTNHKDILIIMAAAALFLLVATASWADQGMSSGHDMKMDGHGQMGMDEDMSFGKHGLRPHNAAEHFLTMKSLIKLTDPQVNQLTKLRDEYIEGNATTEKQLEAAYDDLPSALYADDVDMTTVNTLLDKIGKLESQLWHAYAQQLHDIMAMLTPEQKKILTERWEKAHHGMGDMRGDMSAQHGTKHAH